MHVARELVAQKDQRQRAVGRLPPANRRRRRSPGRRPRRSASRISASNSGGPSHQISRGLPWLGMVERQEPEIEDIADGRAARSCGLDRTAAAMPSREEQAWARSRTSCSSCAISCAPITCRAPAIRTSRPRPSTAWRQRGVLFPRAYVQSGVCGPSRMSYYTGRYMFSHGATWNRVPLSPARKDHRRLSAAGRHPRGAGRQDPCAARYSTGWSATASKAARRIAALMRAGRFEELDRYDGHSPPGEESGYAAYLRAQGYNSDDPWSDYVISADGPDGPSCRAGTCATCTCRRASPRSIPRPPT